jgi:hypothetical protein
MSRTAGPVIGDRASALREMFAIKEQQDAGSDPKRAAIVPARDTRQAEYLPIEAIDSLSVCAVVVKRGFEDPDDI